MMSINLFITRLTLRMLFITSDERFRTAYSEWWPNQTMFKNARNRDV